MLSRNVLVLVCILGFLAPSARSAEQPHSVVLFVADGLRSLIVRADTAPAMAALRDEGVWFENSHAMFPTFTTPNAASMATGHYLGDTGDFGNTLYPGFVVAAAGRSVTPFIENDPVLGELNAHFAGGWLGEKTLLAAARAQGMQTAAVGKLGPTLIQDVTERSGESTIIIDDSTGRPGGIPLAKAIAAAMQEAGLPLVAPGRGENGKAGTSAVPGTRSANVDQQKYFVDIVTKVILPRFKADGRPFFLVVWSRDPDGTQHNQGDSLGTLTPGINGPSSLAAIRNADDNLAAIRAALASLRLDGTTDVFVTADHGFSTITKQSKTSLAAKLSYDGVPRDQLPPGFLAIDLAHALGLPLFDPDADRAPVDAKAGKYPSKSNGLIGQDPDKPDAIVAANGNSDLVYLVSPTARQSAAAVVQALLAQDYVGGVFVDEALAGSPFPGTLPLSSIGLKGSALTPSPAIVISFRSEVTDCTTPSLCAANVADTILQQGQGMHGSLSSADVRNFMAAIGPDFKSRFTDPAPVSNADVGATLARVLGLKLTSRGKLAGRVATEAMAGGKPVKFTRGTLRSAADANGLRTVLEFEAVGSVRYIDAGGIPMRTVGLQAPGPLAADARPAR